MKKITIIDAGLGGISVQVMLDQFLKTQQTGLIVELSFFNMQGVQHYNHISREEGVLVFEELFSRMLQHKPDMVLIACNTLSILYPFTQVSKITPIPVLGIVDIGVQTIINYLDYQKDSTILLLGTPITINSNVHRKKLIQQGITSNKIISQSCKDLQFEIQNGRDKAVEKMLRHYLMEARSKLVEPCSNLIIVLCCTHYHFAKSIFKEITKDIFNINPIILNPNEAMVKAIEWKEELNKKDKVNITHKVFTALDFRNEELETIGKAIQYDAPDVQQALIDHQWY